MDIHFNDAVWQVVASVPEGKLVTYGQVAKLAGYPGYARQVGALMQALPSDTALPWHRVVNAQGRLSLPAASEGYREQRLRLEQEGVEFVKGRVSLKQYLWEP